MVPATAGGTGETLVVLEGQILAELLNAGICTAGGTGLPPVVPAMVGSTDRSTVVPVGLFLVHPRTF